MRKKLDTLDAIEMLKASGTKAVMEAMGEVIRFNEVDPRGAYSCHTNIPKKHMNGK